MSGGIFGYHQNMGRGMLGASSGQKPEIVLNILQRTEQPLTAKIYLAQNINSTKVGKSWSISRTFDKGKPSTAHQKLGLARNLWAPRWAHKTLGKPQISPISPTCIY